MLTDCGDIAANAKIAHAHMHKVQSHTSSEYLETNTPTDRIFVIETNQDNSIMGMQRQDPILNQITGMSNSNANLNIRRT